MSVPRLIVVGCLAALASGLFGYFVLFEPDQSPGSAVPTSDRRAGVFVGIAAHYVGTEHDRRTASSPIR